jgi:hypothetical protein
MTTRKQKYPGVKPKRAPSAVLTEVSDFLWNKKTPPMSDYSVKSIVRLIRLLMAKYDFMEPTVDIAERIRKDHRENGRAPNAERLYLFAREYLSEVTTGEAAGPQEACICQDEAQRVALRQGVRHAHVR